MDNCVLLMIGEHKKALDYVVLELLSPSPATPTSRGYTQLPVACCRLHCILQNGRGNGRQLLCFRSLLLGRKVDCARKTRQLKDLTILLKIFDSTSDPFMSFIFLTPGSSRSSPYIVEGINCVEPFDPRSEHNIQCMYMYLRG